MTKVHDPVAEAVEKKWGEDSERLRLAKAFDYWATKTKSDAYRELFLHTAGVLREDERLIAGPRSTSEREKWFGLHEPKNMPTVKRRAPDELDEKGQVRDEPKIQPVPGVKMQTGGDRNQDRLRLNQGRQESARLSEMVEKQICHLLWRYANGRQRCERCGRMAYKGLHKGAYEPGWWHCGDFSDPKRQFENPPAKLRPGQQPCEEVEWTDVLAHVLGSENEGQHRCARCGERLVAWPFDSRTVGHKRTQEFSRKPGEMIEVGGQNYPGDLLATTFEATPGLCLWSTRYDLPTS